MCLYVMRGSRSVNSAWGVNFGFSFFAVCFRGDVGNILVLVRAGRLTGGCWWQSHQVGPVVRNGSEGSCATFVQTKYRCPPTALSHFPILIFSNQLHLRGTFAATDDISISSMFYRLQHLSPRGTVS